MEARRREWEKSRSHPVLKTHLHLLEIRNYGPAKNKNTQRKEAKRR